MNCSNCLFKPIVIVIAFIIMLTVVSDSFVYAYAADTAVENGVLDLSDCTNEEIISIISSVDKDSVLEVNLMDSEGLSQVDLDTLETISSTFPNAHIKCSFMLFGKTISSEDEVIEFDHDPIGNEGLADIRAVLPYLTSCNYLLLADCDIDNDLLAQLREDFPEKHIVWRIHIFHGIRSYLTDITLFRTTEINDEDAAQLKYCNEVKYIDVGHQKNLSDISFVEGMPELEVLIIAGVAATDISYLKNCKKLEYLELCWTNISDLSPLSELENLQHLDIGEMPKLTDITPLYSLKSLKRLRIVTPLNLDKFRIPREQLDTIARLLPECDMQFGIGDSLSNGWRYDCLSRWSERYRLLRKQMRYDEF